MRCTLHSVAHLPVIKDLLFQISIQTDSGDEIAEDNAEAKVLEPQLPEPEALEEVVEIESPNYPHRSSPTSRNKK